MAKKKQAEKLPRLDEHEEYVVAMNAERLASEAHKRAVAAHRDADAEVAMRSGQRGVTAMVARRALAEAERALLDASERLTEARKACEGIEAELKPEIIAACTPRGSLQAPW